MKSSLSIAFSTKALGEQEAIVADIVNAFIDRIGRDGGVDNLNGLNMRKWYEMVAFDVLGEMAFGESFQCIENGEPHYWQEMILDYLYFITVADNLRSLPFIVTTAKSLAPFMTAVQNKHLRFTRDKVTHRLQSKSFRKDFMSNLVAKV